MQKVHILSTDKTNQTLPVLLLIRDGYINLRVRNKKTLLSVQMKRYVFILRIYEKGSGV
jgi:hypothetical protein